MVMGGVNLTRVLLGGLLAGLVLNIGEYILNEVVLGAQWAAFRAAFALDDFTAAQSVGIAVITFLFGIVLVWLYAAMRPRFGPGPKTAVIAGLTLWSTAWLLISASFLTAGLLTAEMAVTTIVWGFFEAPVAAIAGAWLYKEG